MEKKITLTIDVRTKNFLKEEAKRRNMTMKKVGEEYFYKIVEELLAKEKNLTKTL
jgi:hypothetical protein